MKKILALMMLLSISLAYGQKKGKIKGNREVITRVYTVPPFLRVETDEEIILTLKKTPDTTQIQLRADENLHEVLKWDVNDGTLKLWLSKKIISKKKFEITLYVSDKFQGIVLHNYAKVLTDEKIRLERLYVELHDRSRVDGGFTVHDTVGIRLTDNARLHTDLEAASVRAVLDKDATWEGVVFAKELEVSMSQSADLRLKGNVKHLKINGADRAEFDGRKLDIKNDADIRMTGKAVARIHGKSADRLRIRLDGSTTLTISGNFEHFQVEQFQDNAALQHLSR